MKDFEVSFVVHRIQQPKKKQTIWIYKNRLKTSFIKLALPESITMILSDFKIVFSRWLEKKKVKPYKLQIK